MATPTKYVKFTYPISSYFPEALQNIALQDGSDKALRKEYTRLRDVAQKRIKRMGGSEFARTRFYKTWKDRFPKLKEIHNTSELTHALSEAATFLTSYLGGTKGMEEYRRKEVESLQAAGFDWITNANFFEFTDFMDWLQEFDRNYYPSNLMDVLKEGFEMGKTQQELRTHFEKYRDSESSTVPLFSEV